MCISGRPNTLHDQRQTFVFTSWKVIIKAGREEGRAPVSQDGRSGTPLRGRSHPVLLSPLPLKSGASRGGSPRAGTHRDPPLSCCVTLGELPLHSGGQFPHLQMGGTDSIAFPSWAGMDMGPESCTKGLPGPQQL